MPNDELEKLIRERNKNRQAVIFCFFLTLIWLLVIMPFLNALSERRKALEKSDSPPVQQKVFPLEEELESPGQESD